MTVLRFHRLAAEELRTAEVWYAGRDQLLAARFVRAVDVRLLGSLPLLILTRSNGGTIAGRGFAVFRIDSCLNIWNRDAS
jgi:hypothetical protein